MERATKKNGKSKRLRFARCVYCEFETRKGKTTCGEPIIKFDDGSEISIHTECVPTTRPDGTTGKHRFYYLNKNGSRPPRLTVCITCCPICGRIFSEED